MSKISCDLFVWPVINISTEVKTFEEEEAEEIVP
jgi:hypothetical protein